MGKRDACLDQRTDADFVTIGIIQMTCKKFEPNAWGCPFCDYEVESDESDQYIDDERDESERQCPECGKAFRLQCVAVDLYFESKPSQQVAT